MTQKEIAKATGFAQSYVHYILKGDRIPTVKNAKLLEQATGICREGWIFPERHWNPYIPFSKITNCGGCRNRINRVRKICNLMLEHFDPTLSKKENAERWIEISGAFTDGASDALAIFREIFPDELRLLSAIGKNSGNLPESLRGDSCQDLINNLRSEGTIAAPFYPYGVPEGHDPNKLGRHVRTPKSYYRFTSGRHIVFFLVFRKVVIVYTEEIIRTFQETILKLDNLWHDAYYS